MIESPKQLFLLRVELLEEDQPGSGIYLYVLPTNGRSLLTRKLIFDDDPFEQ